MLNMDKFAETITQPWMVLVFVSIILLVALRPLYQSIVSIKLVNDELNKATHVLVQLGTEHQQEEFYKRFKAINSRISKIEVLRHAWREFVDSMYFENTTHKKAYLSHRPSRYFNRDSVLGKQINLSQFLAYPNYLIGIGLTFTFIGLTAALHVAQAGLASGAGQQALKDLLAVASIKFISSIAGIFSSLVISALQRIRIRQFQQKLSAFCELLEECTEYKSTEKLLHDSFHEQQKHTVILNDMATNIASSIGVMLSDQLPASVGTALAPLMQEMQLLAQAFTGSCENALRNVLEEFLNQLRKSSAKDIQGLIDGAKILRESLDGLLEHMESTGKSFDATTHAAKANLTNMMAEFTASFAPVQLGIGQFGKTLVSLDAIAGKIDHAGETINNAASENKNSTAVFAKSISDLSAHFAPIGGALEILSQSINKVDATALNLKMAGGSIITAADGFKTSAASIEQTLQAIQSTELKMQQNQQELQTILRGLQQSTENIPQLWKQYEERFSKVDGDLGKTFGELAKGSEEFRSGIQVFVMALDEQFTKTITALNETMKALAKENGLPVKESHYFSKLKAKWGK